MVVVLYTFSRGTTPVGAVIGGVMGGLLLIIIIVIVSIVMFSTRVLYKSPTKYTFKAVRLTITVIL